VLANLAHNYSQLASIYSLRNQHSLALQYAEQALDYSEQAEDNHYAAEYSSFIAVEHARLNQFDDAENGLKKAFDYLVKIEAGRPRNFTEVLVLTNAGEVAVRHADLPRAFECYERAEALAAGEKENTLPMIKLLGSRAEAYIASSRNDRALSDLMRAVSLIEKYRAYISTSDQRSHFLDASHAVYDQLISLDIGALDRSPEAFEMSEQSRARALLEEISRKGETAKHRSPDNSSQSYTSESRSSGMAKPLKLGDVQSQLPDDLTLLEYSVTSKGTYLFVVTRSGFKTLKSSATTEVLERLVHDYVLDLRQLAPLDEVTAKGRALYDYLIKPVEGDIGGNTNLCIVPDKALHFLPFAGLVDRSNKYLIESRRLTYAPSASVLVQCTKEARAKPADGQERILAVGNPQFSGEYFPNLPPLVDAEKEAGVSASFYKPGSSVLTGAEATERRVRAAMTECDVAHLAVHCVVEERSPWLAALVLARTSAAQGAAPPGSESGAATGLTADSSRKDTNKRTGTLTNLLPQEPVVDSSDGLLYLSELYDIKLPRTRLVVLSACQSGLGQYYRGEGIVSLVRPFLAVGVPTVMATLWAVDSRATSDLMIEFHRQRKVQNLRAGDALRVAQIEMARSGSYQHPYYWAPFIVVGSNLRTN
jgi:CHAT domain-containing protein/tetratricopeptide (TPR) repeat protein